MTTVTGLIALLSQRESSPSHRAAFTPISVTGISQLFGSPFNLYPNTYTVTVAAGTVTRVFLYAYANDESVLIGTRDTVPYQIQVTTWAQAQALYEALWHSTAPSSFALDFVAKAVGADDSGFFTATFTQAAP